ncbi:MAG: hypothetical protein CMN91_09875 [Synechococcus sp. ARS1019]|nr:hypothetical protein [Synechococcus sp. ARS1019]
MLARCCCSSCVHRQQSQDTKSRTAKRINQPIEVFRRTALVVATPTKSFSGVFLHEIARLN